MTRSQLQTRKPERRRGILLTQQGLGKLCQAKIHWEREQYLQRYTLERLGEETGLTPTTLSKIFTGSSPVDKRTVASCFIAFNLTLLPEDYLYGKLEQNGLNFTNLTEENEDNSGLEKSDRSSSEIISLNNAASDISAMYPLNNNFQLSAFTIPGGQIPLNSTSYIDRPNLESLCYEAIQYPGIWINIIAPKQMGKTSLMTRILAYAQTQNYYTVSVNLNTVDIEILKNTEQFVYWFCAVIKQQLGLSKATIELWNWEQPVGIKTNITSYFEEIILAQGDRPLVVAIDELNQLFEYPILANEFLRLLRSWSEKAKTHSVWKKLRLVTANSTEIPIPCSLAPSLFNTGLVIKLPELTFAQIQDLAHRFEEEINEQQLKQLITILGGHPYRLQLAFYHLQRGTILLNTFLEKIEPVLEIYSEHLQQQWWYLQRYPHLWKIFSEIVQQPSPVKCQAELTFQLQQLGLVRLQRGQVYLYCELFRSFFRDRLPSI
ncbi:MAG: AAA-like domain-containing protein [Microcystaceae cyanobacterium]